MSDERIEYPWWSGFLTLLLTLGSLAATSWGTYLVTTGWDPVARWALIGVFAVCNIAAVALGFVGAENWQRGAKALGAISLAFGLVAALLSGVGTMRALTNMFAQNADALRVEAGTETGRDQALERAEKRVERARSNLAPLEAAAAAAQREFERESASGFGPKAQERKTEWDAALARLAAPRRELTDAEERLASMGSGAAPVARSDAALVAERTTDFEQTLQIWLGTGIIELLPMLSGWLFGMRVARAQDPFAAALAPLVEAVSMASQEIAQMREEIARMTAISGPLVAAAPAPASVDRQPAPRPAEVSPAPMPKTAAQRAARARADLGKMFGGDGPAPSPATAPKPAEMSDPKIIRAPVRFGSWGRLRPSPAHPERREPVLTNGKAS